MDVALQHGRKRNKHIVQDLDECGSITPATTDLPHELGCVPVSVASGRCGRVIVPRNFRDKVEVEAAVNFQLDLLS